MWLLPSVVWALLSSILGSELSFQESSLLRSLGLSTRPSPKSPKPVPPVLWRIFQERKRLLSADKEPVDNCRVEEFNVPGNIIRVFSDQGPFLPKEQPQGWLCLRKLLLFNLSVRDEGERLTMAQLELKFHHNSYQPSSQGEVFELRLYQSAQGSPQGPPQPGQELLVGQSLAQLHKSLVLDVSAAAKKGWRSSRTLGWLLEISGATRGGCSGIDSFLDTSLLVVSLGGQCQAPGSSRRSRRSSGHPQVMPSNLCKPRRLFISFSDVGWEKWIIAPQGYLANYCRGECPFPLAAELNSTNHAVLQTMVHSQDPRGTPQPCCVPVRLSPISILYYDNSDNVVLRHYEDMVVDECGCR